MPDTSVVHIYLQRLGIDPTAAKIYLLLLERNNPSVLQLSKSLQISRTQVESRLVQLRQAGLASGERDRSGLRYKALPFENVERLITAKEAELQLLHSQFKDMSQSVLTASVQPRADARHYRGTDGIKQVTGIFVMPKGNTASLKWRASRSFSARHLRPALVSG